MSNAGRPKPSLSKRNTRGTKENRDKELDQGARLTIEGRTYQARVGDVTPQMNRELRRATGFGFLGLMRELANEPDSDVISAFVWVARRVEGDFVDIDDVIVDYDSILEDGFEIHEATPETVPEEGLENHPE